MADTWTVVGALASLVAASTGLAAVYDGWARRSAERRIREDTEASLWALRSEPAWRRGHYALTLRYEDIAHLPIYVVSVAVIEPTPTMLCEGKAVPTGGMPSIEPLEDKWSEMIEFNRDLAGTFVIHPEGIYGQTNFALIHLLARPVVVREGDRGRFKLRIVLEERTAKRRCRTLTVSSEAVAWGPPPLAETG